ncbi:peptidylprolyl isomerase [Rhodoferax sp. GW822-FHT02A01]|uniref:peptidylprolyl isomerase n=1 Tax=Rhodoferax sp. GW822-FHT02A01 TaxID=3141537 RepID=UPI00315C545D
MKMTYISRRLALGITAALCLSTAALADAASTTSQVKFQTSLGDFTVEVYADKAPKTVENFLQYVKDKHYNGTIFHRVMDGFMVQGGGLTQEMKDKPTREPIPLEARNGLKNDRGTIAMARTGNPNSATAQFFINVVDNQGLNAPAPDGYGYAVFGKVVAGMDTIDKIRVAPTGNKGPYQNVPLTPIVINSATLVK